ncbi:uncharacterized protein LOC135106724 [Scylla paramamosain]|uniref:uncharacterized protein LOC135106724 n=1 Tax=Scylla paramamosain TaxID=85552 RepID=UPI003082D8B4
MVVVIMQREVFHAPFFTSWFCTTWTGLFCPSCLACHFCFRRDKDSLKVSLKTIAQNFRDRGVTFTEGGVPRALLHLLVLHDLDGALLPVLPRLPLLLPEGQGLTQGLPQNHRAELQGPRRHFQQVHDPVVPLLHAVAGDRLHARLLASDPRLH